MKVDTSYNNFSRGKIDHNMNGRFDLPIYNSGADTVENFITNFQGNAIYRAGFESMLVFQDCVMIEFKFNNQQQYIAVFYANKIRFLSYDSNGDFGWVLDAGLAILEVATPYTLAESRELDFTQDKDVMIVTHKDHEPRKLVRVSANSFTFLTYGRKFDPFPLTFQATKTITAVTQAANAQVTAAGHGYSAGDRVKIAGIVGMTQLNDWTATIISIVDANNFTIDIDTTTFTAYSSAGTAAKVLTGDYPRCCLFYKARLYYGSARVRITTLFGSVVGSYYDHTLTPVSDTSALQVTIADIAQAFEWLFPGDNSLIIGASDGIVAVNGGSVGATIKAATIEATLTSAPPCNSAYPIKKDGYIFYVSTDGRSMQYFEYDLLKEAFKADDANLLSYEITEGGITKLRYKKDRNDLIIAINDGNLLTCNFKNLGQENINGWHEHITEGDFIDEAVITDNNGKPQLFCLVLRNGNYYIERQGEYVQFISRDSFFTDEDTNEDDRIAYNRYIAEQLKECIFLDGCLIYSDLKDNLITYDSIAGTITAASNVFALTDEGKEIVYKTETGYESGRFEITNYVSATVVEVDVLQEPTSNTYQEWYLSFDEITSGLSQFDTKTVGVVADGGYLDDFLITGGAVALGKQVTHVVIGYKYKGIIKSFCLGFQVQGTNTQKTKKAINGFNIRCVSTAGLKCGSSLYRLQSVQELSPNDINYLPPIPIDGTSPDIVYVDDHEEDKYFYIVQDLPLPAVVTCVMVTGKYTGD